MSDNPCVDGCGQDAATIERLRERLARLDRPTAGRAEGRMRSVKMEGWPASACPGCGVKVQPGQMTTYAPKGHPGPAEGNGDIWPWHTLCLSPICRYCDDEHARPYDGGCLL